MEKILAILGSHKVFASLTQEELASLSGIVERVTYEQGTVIFSINENPNFFFLIESGSFRLQLPNNETKKFSAGQLIGEIGIINGDFRTGTVISTQLSTVIRICGTRLFNEKFIAPAVSLKIVRILGKRITNYLRSKEQVATNEIIRKGENNHVEFKSTLRWNLYTDKKDKAIEQAVLKTLAAFMNSDGGLLIIGVADDGALLGLEKDQFANQDKMLLHLTSLIKEKMGAIYLQFLIFHFETIDDVDILRIDCKPSSLPVYCTYNSLDHFYIRTGPSTTDLRLNQVYTFIKDRFV